jgi:hypothetical protein
LRKPARNIGDLETDHLQVPVDALQQCQPVPGALCFSSLYGAPGLCLSSRAWRVTRSAVEHPVAQRLVPDRVQVALAFAAQLPELPDPRLKQLE